MKKVLVLVFATLLLFSLSACDDIVEKSNKNRLPSQNNPTSNGISAPNVSDAKITREKAIEIALEKAKLKETDVRDLEAELDYERDLLVWDVDFDYKNFDYAYEINANTGDIVTEKTERDDF